MHKLFITLALFASSTASYAGEKIFEPVKDKPDVVLDAQKSYLVIRSTAATPMVFVRRPEKEELEDYMKRRGEALSKAHAKWVKKHASWKSNLASWKKQAPAGRDPKPPVEPVEPNDLNLAFPSIEEENMIQIGPLNRFGKQSDSSTYVHMVRPGSYAFYGPVFMGIGAPSTGSCMCMGSIEFDIGKGEIVNAGTVKSNLTDAYQLAKDKAIEKPKDDFDLPAGINAMGWGPPSSEDAMDARLSKYKVTAAKLRPSRRFPNYFGVFIDRLTAIPGILEYDRDKIIEQSSK